MAAPQVKVCCIADLAEARLAMAAGAAALGLVSAMPSGPGVIDEAVIAEVATAVAAEPVQTFLLTAHQRADAIATQHRRCRTTTLQLVDEVAPHELRQLREAVPGVALVQVIHVVGPASIDEALAVAPWVDALLLDSGNPAATVKQLGGTGRTHDWATSRRIVEAVERPVWLAGGLRADNVRQAIGEVGPHGLDLCSGVRVNGRLDAQRLSAFFAAVADASA